jgi:hypothetical protein
LGFFYLAGVEYLKWSAWLFFLFLKDGKRRTHEHVCAENITWRGNIEGTGKLKRKREWD